MGMLFAVAEPKPGLFGPVVSGANPRCAVGCVGRFACSNQARASHVKAPARWKIEGKSLILIGCGCFASASRTKYAVCLKALVAAAFKSSLGVTGLCSHLDHRILTCAVRKFGGPRPLPCSSRCCSSGDCLKKSVRPADELLTRSESPASSSSSLSSPALLCLQRGRRLPYASPSSWPPPPPPAMPPRTGVALPSSSSSSISSSEPPFSSLPST